MMRQRVRRVAPALLLAAMIAALALGTTGASAAPGNDVVVAVNADSAIFVSADNGTTWTAATEGATAFLYGVAKGPDKFVVPGGSNADCGKVFTSPDGTTWTTNDLGQTDKMCFRDIAYADHQYVAIGIRATSSTRFIATSPDGLAWTVRETPSVSVNHIAHRAGVWVAVTDNTTGYRSTDGVTWTTVTISGCGSCLGVHAAGDRFLATGVSGVLRSSTDGSTWTSVTSPTSNLLYFAGWASSSNLYVIGGEGGIWTSPDLTTWTSRSTLRVRAITTTSAGLITGGFAGLLTSSNGTSWTTRLGTQSGDFTAIAGGTTPASPPTTTTTTTSTTAPPTTTTTNPIDGPCRWEWGGMQELDPQPCPYGDEGEFELTNATGRGPTDGTIEIGATDLLALGLVIVAGSSVLRAAVRRG